MYDNSEIRFCAEPKLYSLLVHELTSDLCYMQVAITNTLFTIWLLSYNIK